MNVVLVASVWGLRCGHMLDDTCIDELMAPRPAPDSELIWTEVAAIAPSTNGLQGQSSSTQSQEGTQSVVPGEATPSDGKSASRLTKAKGKARAIEPPAYNQIAFAENNSIYPHLRPRNNTGHVDHIFSSSPTLSHTLMEPMILERHEWRFPVAPIESRSWVMNETQGNFYLCMM
ncbi:hypothetical protein BGY98DRAFT_979378, partial [Russula aff. rugulosa BPL654]